LTPGASNRNGHPCKKLKLKNQYYFYEFSVICIINLKFVVSRKSNCILLKIFILPPLGLGCPGRSQNSRRPSFTLDYKELLIYALDVEV
jgi:hypothetical protein